MVVTNRFDMTDEHMCACMMQILREGAAAIPAFENDVRRALCTRPFSAGVWRGWPPLHVLLAIDATPDHLRHIHEQRMTIVEALARGWDDRFPFMVTTDGDTVLHAAVRCRPVCASYIADCMKLFRLDAHQAWGVCNVFGYTPADVAARLGHELHAPVVERDPPSTIETLLESNDPSKCIEALSTRSVQHAVVILCGLCDVPERPRVSLVTATAGAHSTPQRQVRTVERVVWRLVRHIQSVWGDADEYALWKERALAATMGRSSFLCRLLLSIGRFDIGAFAEFMSHTSLQHKVRWTEDEERLYAAVALKQPLRHDCPAVHARMLFASVVERRSERVEQHILQSARSVFELSAALCHVAGDDWLSTAQYLRSRCEELYVHMCLIRHHDMELVCAHAASSTSNFVKCMRAWTARKPSAEYSAPVIWDTLDRLFERTRIDTREAFVALACSIRAPARWIEAMCAWFCEREARAWIPLSLAGSFFASAWFCRGAKRAASLRAILAFVPPEDRVRVCTDTFVTGDARAVRILHALDAENVDLTWAARTRCVDLVMMHPEKWNGQIADILCQYGYMREAAQIAQRVSSSVCTRMYISFHCST